MNKVLIVGALLAIVCTIASFAWLNSSVFDVSTKDPFGKFETVDQWLLKKKFEKEVRTVSEDGDGFSPELEGAQLVVYHHEYKDRMDSHESTVSIVKDQSGAFHGLRTRFWSGKEELGHAGFHGSRAENLVNLMWIEFAGEKPKFQEELRGHGRYRSQSLVATVRQNGAVGVWEKRYGTNGDSHTIVDTVTFARE